MTAGKLAIQRDGGSDAIVIVGPFSEGGGPLVYCHRDGTFELKEVPQYGGYERSHGFRVSIQEALKEAETWT